MDKKLKNYVNATSWFVGLAALVCNLIASGITVDNVSDLIDKASPEASGSLADYWTTFTVFFATAPIVLAALASALLIYHAGIKQWVAWVTAGIWFVAILASAAVVHPVASVAASHAGSATPSPVSTGSLGSGCSIGTAQPHVIESPDITFPVEEPSARCSFRAVPPPPGIRSQLSHSPLGVLLSIFSFEFKWIFTAYGKVLAIQGIAVGVIGSASIIYFSQKWAEDEKKAAAEGKKKHKELMDRQVAAYRDRDLEGFLACYAADVKIKDFDGNVLMDGLEAMRGKYGALFRDSPQLKADISRRIVTGDYVIDEEYGSGIVVAGFPAEKHIAVVYRVRDGLIHDVMLVR